MKRTITKSRLLTVFLTFLALFLGYFIVTTEYYPGVKSWIAANVSRLPNHFHQKSLKTGKVIANSHDEGKYSVTSVEISDIKRAVPSKPPTKSMQQEQGAPGSGVPKGQAVTPMTGWPLLKHRAEVVQQVCRRFRVQHAPAGSDNGPRGTTAAGT